MNEIYNDPRVFWMEEIAKLWNKAAIVYSIAHGIENYPKQLGRDIDVLVDRKDLKRAVAIAKEYFISQNFKVIIPLPDPWGKVSIFAFYGQIMFEIDFIYKGLYWGPVTLLSNNISPTKKIGPFKIDIWGYFVKCVIVKLLGKGKIQINIKKDEIDLINKKMSIIFGRKLTDIFLYNLKEHNLDTFGCNLECKIIIFLRCLFLRPYEFLCNSIRWPLREFIPYFFRLFPVITLIGSNDAKQRFIDSIKINGSFFTGVDVINKDSCSLFNAIKILYKCNIISNTMKICIYNDNCSYKKNNSWKLRIFYSILRPEIVVFCGKHKELFEFYNKNILTFVHRNNILYFKGEKMDGGNVNIINTVLNLFIDKYCKKEKYNVFVSLLGPDGSGKSTLLQNLRRDFEKDGKKIEIFHLMPRILKKAKNNGPVTNPHSKAPWPGWISILKLIYYWLDYNLGYWLKVRPLLKRGDIVFFDRYYDDLLVDPRRYRYGGPMWLAKILSKFIPRPDLFIVLDVPEDEIIKRKQEVPIEEIKRQRQEYLKLACELKNAVIVDASLPPQEVARQAKSAILDLLYHKHLFKNTKTGDFSNTKEYLEKSLNAKIDKGTTFLTFFLPDGRGYLLPENQKLALRSLSLYAPQKFKAKALKKMLEISFSLKFGQYLLPKICIDIEWLETFVKDMFGRDDLSFAISLGTPGPNRKPVIQVLSSKGEIIAYVKIGWNEKTIKLVRNESERLTQLGKLNLSFIIPNLIAKENINGRFLNMQSSVSQNVKLPNVVLSDYYINAVCDMSEINLKNMVLKESDFFSQILDKNKLDKYPWIIGEIEKINNSLSGKPIVFHLCHGDFAPWNSAISDERLYLYDWEYAKIAPAGYDLFHFLFQTARLINGYGLNKTVEFVLKNVAFGISKRYWDKLGMDDSFIILLFRLYLLDKMVLEEDNDFEKAYNILI